MDRCYYYTIIHPPKGEIEDNLNTPVAFKIQIHHDELEDVWFSLLLYKDQSPMALRWTFPMKESDKRFDKRILKIISSCKQHFLTVIKMEYDPNILLEKKDIWIFRKKGSDGISVIFNYHPAKRFPSNSVKNLFSSSWELRHEFKLISDATDEHIPIQFRYLSMYKFLENEFKSKGYWQKKDLGAALEMNAEAFNRLGKNQKPANLIHNFRDRCAHIKTNSDEFGVSQLSNEDSYLGEMLIKAMTPICIEILNKKAVGKFSIHQNEEESKITEVTSKPSK